MMCADLAAEAFRSGHAGVATIDGTTIRAGISHRGQHKAVQRVGSDHVHGRGRSQLYRERVS